MKTSLPQIMYFGRRSVCKIGSALVGLLCSAFVVSAQTPAFPGALGFGSVATGGRGGTVYHVTTLADSGAGSFRDAVSSGNRIIVFDVGGYISLSSAVSCQGNLTIAGQTAPGGGIGIKGGEVSFAGRSNIIMRHVRVRPGSDTTSTSDDALSLYQARNAIFDHCSFEFGPWNNIDGVGDSTHVITNITFQNCMVADPTYQQFGCHSESVGGSWSWFYNVFANSHNRNPLAKVDTVFLNNAEYNCSAGYTTHTSTHFKHDIVNNYFVDGPASGSDFPWYQMDTNQSIYYSGNLHDSDQNTTLNGSTTTPYPGYQGTGTILSAPWSSWTTTAPVMSTALAWRHDVSLAGALPRDEIDSLVVSQMKTLGNGPIGTGAGTAGPSSTLYTSQTQTGLGNNGYGTINGGTPPVDSDGDAMPDYWETSMGLNSNDASDASTLDADGYSHLEHYLNWLADLHATTATGTAVDVELSQYAAGFSASATYSVAAPVNGTVSMINATTAEFVPTSGFAGLGSFQFLVNDGVIMTNTINVLVTGTGFVNTNPPAAPAGLAANAGNAEVVVSWSAATGATSYNVKRATVSGGPYTTLASPTATSFLDRTVVNGTTYYYVVSAVNGNGESANSSEVTATPQAPLYQINSGAGALSPYAADAWFSGGSTYTNTSASVSTNGVFEPAPMAAYQTERKGDFSYIFPNLTAGANYRVRLHFAEIYFSTSGQRTFNVAINGTQVLTNFDIFAASGGKDIAIVKEFTTPSDGSGQITVQYTTVLNNAKSSAIEIYPADSGTPAPQPPAAPTALAAIGGNLVANLNWTQSTSPGITGNNVYRSTTGNGGPYNLLANLAATTSYSDTAVSAGSTYYYSVTAVNTNGESALSAYAGATTIPAAPAGLTATAGNAQVALAWTASTGATSYNVKRATVSGGPYTGIGSASSASFADTTAANGTTYFYVVSAVNSSGESGNSSEVSATPQAPAAPAAPTNLAASAGRKKITLTWTQSSSPNIATNNIYRATASGGPYTQVASVPATTTYSNSGLTTGTTYYYVVTAVDGSGAQSPYSNEASATSK